MKASTHNSTQGVQVPLCHPGPATCFATLRLSGSLPPHVLRELSEQRKACQNVLARLVKAPSNDAARAEEELTCLEELDRYLARHRTGPLWLAETPIATMTADALRQKDGVEYDLLLYCIMPNHLHCIIDTGRFHGEQPSASKVLSAVKRQTAHEANALLHRTGPFWEHDHLEYPVSTAEVMRRILWEVLSDPVRSDLCPAWHEWPWSYCRPGFVVSNSL